MPVREQHRKVVEEMTRCMQIGPQAEHALLDLFTDDAVLVEPFAGRSPTHAGKRCATKPRRRVRRVGTKPRRKASRAPTAVSTFKIASPPRCRKWPSGSNAARRGRRRE